MKQTPLQEFNRKLQETFPDQIRDMYNSNQYAFEAIVLEAKQKEKQGIIEAFNYTDENLSTQMNGEQYFSETYEETK